MSSSPPGINRDDNVAAQDRAETIRRCLWNNIPGQWPPVRIDAAHDALDALLAENERLRDLFRPEPYHGVRFKLVCSSCGGQGEVNGRNSDDPRWIQCLTCKGDGLAQAAREALSRV